MSISLHLTGPNNSTGLPPSTRPQPRFDAVCNTPSSTSSTPAPTSEATPSAPPTQLMTVVIAMVSGELIVSKYVAESITMIAGRFGHEGLCQLRTELFCTQLTKAFVAETSCNHCY